MLFRAVGNRCAFWFGCVLAPLTREEILLILERKGFAVVEENPVPLARERVGKATYRRGAQLREAPHVFDCSGFTKWVYGKCGAWLPRRPVQQRECGEAGALATIQAGDLVFTTGYRNCYRDDPQDGVGHVGIATGEGTVVEARNPRSGVVETSLGVFLKNAPSRFRGVRRIVPRPQETVVLTWPPTWEIETSDDIMWRVLSAL